MRFGDLFNLALAALWQQKVRTVLTTLGVICGACVLALSGSIGEGVQATISTEMRRGELLRRIEVWPNWQGRETDLSADEIAIKGEMTDARRQRIRRAAVDRKLRSQPRSHILLDPERLRELAALEHVESVTPQVELYGWAVWNENTISVRASSTAVHNEAIHRRVESGRFFERSDEPAILISEYLAYEWGLFDEAQIAQLMGRKVRLEFRSERRRPGIVMYLLKADSSSEVTRDEAAALDKVKTQLPAALDKLALTPTERDALRKAMPSPGAADGSGTEIVTAELTVIGVVRMPEVMEANTPWDRMNNDADVYLPVDTARSLFQRIPNMRDRGFDFARVSLDDDKAVKETLGRIRALGLNANAPIEYIERERLMYVIIFSSMSAIAAVALLVSALGIANTMFMSVLERTREIGVMKAVGAGDGQIKLIFLIEGAVIGLIGGSLGLLLGWGLSFPGDAWLTSLVARDFQFQLKQSLFIFPAWLTIGVVLFATLVTTLAAVFPARRAARVNPIAALRHE